MSAVIGSVRAMLSASSAEFDRDMREAGNAVDRFSQRFSQMGRQLQRTGAVMSAAITAPLALFGRQALGDFQRQEDAIAAVDAVLSSMGTTAGFTSEQLQAMAAEMQAATTFADEDILRSVTANLLTFGNIAGDSFQRAQHAALDLSALLGTDLQSATLMLGRALNDPVAGLTALTRAGVTFSDEQKEMIRAMAEMGDLAGAQNVILMEMERQYGNVAETMARTTSGQMQQLSNAWGDFREQIGAVIAQALPPLIEILREVVDWLSRLDQGTIEWVVAIGAVAAAVGPVLVVLGTLARAIATLAPLVTGLIAVLTGPVGLVVAMVALAAAVVYYWDDIVAAFEWAADQIIALLERIWQAVVDLKDRVVGAVGDMVDGITGAFDGLWDGAVATTEAAAEEVVGWFAWVYDEVVGNSWVPDLIDRIAEEFGRLQAVMVTPAEDAARATEGAFRGVSHRLAGIFDDFLRTGKFTFDSLRKLASDFAQQMFRDPFLQALSGMLSGGISRLFGGGSLLGTGGAPSIPALPFGSNFAGLYARGGTIPRGHWGIAGEDGPEPIFAGSGDLTVLPHEAMGMGRGMVQNFYISTPDADSFRRSERQISRSAKSRLALGAAA